MKYNGLRWKLHFVRRRVATRWTRWRVSRGAPIPHANNYDVLDVWHVDQISEALGLPTVAVGTMLTSDWWNAVAEATELPTHAQMQTMYGDQYAFPAWLLNAAIDAANARRRSA